MPGAYENSLVGAVIRGDANVLMQVLRYIERDSILTFRPIISCMLQTNYILAYKMLASNKGRGRLKLNSVVKSQKAFDLLRPFLMAQVNLDIIIRLHDIVNFHEIDLFSHLDNINLSKMDCLVLNQLNDFGNYAGTIDFKQCCKFAVELYTPDKLMEPLSIAAELFKTQRIKKNQKMPWWCEIDSFCIEPYLDAVIKKMPQLTRRSIEDAWWFYEIIAAGDKSRYINYQQVKTIYSLLRKRSNPIIKKRKDWQEKGVPAIKTIFNLLFG